MKTPYTLNYNTIQIPIYIYLLKIRFLLNEPKVNNIDENTDILVYQPNSEINDILKMARRLNIELFTLGSFNKNLIFKR